MRADDILPDDQSHAAYGGLAVRKGTIAAFLHNAHIWCDPTSPSTIRAVVERDMIAAMPALRALGLFDVFAIRDEALAEWLAAHMR